MKKKELIDKIKQLESDIIAIEKVSDSRHEENQKLRETIEILKQVIDQGKVNKAVF